MGMSEMHQGWWDPRFCSSRCWGTREAGAACLCASTWESCGGLAGPKQALISLQPLALKSLSMPGFSS